MTAKKPEREILQEELTEGLGALRRTTVGLFMSGLSGGLDVGFSVLLMAVVVTLATGVWDDALIRLVVANMYAIGFILVVMGRSELFTEQTTLAVLPVLHRRANLADLGRLWGIVYVANLIGATAFAGLVVVVGPALEAVDPSAFGVIAQPLVEPPWWVILLSAGLAGWLMGMLSWLVTAGRDTISQVLFVWLITASIGFAHLHHSILGTVEVLSAVFAGQGVTPMEFGKFLLWTTLGNSVGGAVFVAGLKYTHAIRGRRLQQVDLDPPEVTER